MTLLIPLVVKYKGPICKTGVHCIKQTKNNKCCTDDKIISSLMCDKDYHVHKIHEYDGDLYYELQGWGTMIFNAKCFTVVSGTMT